MGNQSKGTLNIKNVGTGEEFYYDVDITNSTLVLTGEDGIFEYIQKDFFDKEELIFEINKKEQELEELKHKLEIINKK